MPDLPELPAEPLLNTSPAHLHESLRRSRHARFEWRLRVFSVSRIPRSAAAPLRPQSDRPLGQTESADWCVAPSVLLAKRPIEIGFRLPEVGFGAVKLAVRLGEGGLLLENVGEQSGVLCIPVHSDPKLLTLCVLCRRLCIQQGARFCQ